MRLSRTTWILTSVAVLAMAVFALGAMHGRHFLGRKPHSVVLRWNPSEGATSYKIYRSDGQDYHYKLVGSASQPTYVDSPAPSGVLYYAVTAIRNEQESPFSNKTRVEVP